MTSTMSDTEAVREQIEDFVDRCRPYIADLQPVQRQQLEDDIRQIVAEVAAELRGLPDDLVGPPVRFVAELRTAAGFPVEPRPTAPLVPEHGVSRSMVDDLFRLGRWGKGVALPWSADLLNDLRPAWWVLRAVALTFLLGLVHESIEQQGALPNVFGSSFLGFSVMIALIVASVRVGRRGLDGMAVPNLTRRIATVVASALAAITLLTLVGSFVASSSDMTYAVGDVGSEGGIAAQPVAPVPADFEMSTTTMLNSFSTDGTSSVQIGSDVAAGGFTSDLTSLEGAESALQNFIDLQVPPASVWILVDGEPQTFTTYNDARSFLNSLADQGLLFACTPSNGC